MSQYGFRNTWRGSSCTGVFWQFEKGPDGKPIEKKRPCELCGEPGADEHAYSSGGSHFHCGPCSFAWVRYKANPPFQRPYFDKSRPDLKFCHINHLTGELEK